MAKKASPESFKSIQILSEKAQSLWALAKSRMQASAESKNSKIAPPPQEKGKNTVFLDVRSGTVAKATLTMVLVLSFMWLLFAVRDKILILVLSFFVAVVIDTHVRRLERLRIPRALSVLILYIFAIAIVVFLIASLVPIVALQIKDLANLISHSSDTFLTQPNVHLPFLSNAMNDKLTILTQNALENMGIRDRASALFHFGQQLSEVAQSSLTFAVQIAGSVFNFIMNLILILSFAFFIQLEREKISDFFRALLPRNYRGYYDAKADAIYHKVSQWFQGQLILCISIGALTFIALAILGMPYAQTLALVAGFTEFIPYVGPLIGAVPAVIIALTQNGIVSALVVAGVYYIIQSCENNLLVPLIMKHAVGLSPISILFGMLIGVSFPDTIHPVLGILLAVPTTAVITIFVQDFYALRKKK